MIADSPHFITFDKIIPVPFVVSGFNMERIS